MVFGTAWRILGNRDDCDDVLQEVFLRLLRSADSFDSVRDWGAYLRTMATHAAVDLLRRARNRPLGIEQIDLIPDGDHRSPRVLAEQREQLDRLRAALARLRPREAAIFSLRYFDDLSYEAIAEQTGLATGQIGVILHRARRRLATILAAGPARPTEKIHV